MPFFNKNLIDTYTITIWVVKTECFLMGMYKGTTFIGCVWDWENHPIKDVIIMANDLFPKNINDLDTYKKKFKGRVDYGPHTSELKDYHLLTEKEWIKKELNQQLEPQKSIQEAIT